MEREFLVSVLNRLEVISDRLTQVLSQVGRIDERLVMFEDRLEKFEELREVLSKKQADLERALSDANMEIRNLKDAVERQAKEIKEIKLDLRNTQETIEPLQNLSSAFKTLQRAILYGAFFLVVFELLLVLSSKEQLIEFIRNIFLLGR